MTAQPHEPEALRRLMTAETAHFLAHHSRSVDLAAASAKAWWNGAPMHWMLDWASPTPIFADSAQGARLTDVDGQVYDDFCLGDTPSMFGHARPEVATALCDQAGRGVGFMLPTAQSNAVATLLAARFRLPLWQTTVTATDANRAAIRWARAVTGRNVILVFDGCYHGAVEDCFVTLDEAGQTIAKPGLIGQAADLTLYSRCISFNDLDALESALARHDVAAVLAEPVMTNCGMIAPDPGFHAALRELTRQAGTLLVLDETHTLSSGPSGYCGLHNLQPDILTLGKAVAGGFPAAVWGMTAEMAARMNAAHAAIAPGPSGIGTTLAGNALSMAAMHAMLSQVMTAEAYGLMLAGAERLHAGLERVIARRGKPWCVVSVGARVELVLTPTPPRDAAQVRAGLDQALLKALNLFLINRGLLIAPFHTMMLISPLTSDAQIDRLVETVDAFVVALEASA